MKKSIAIFSDNLHVGGIQKSIVNILNNINYNEYNIDLYLFDDNNFYEISKKANLIILKRPPKILKFIPFKLAKKIYNPKLPKKEYDISIDFDSYQMQTAICALKVNAKKRAIWIHNDIKIKLKEELRYNILHFFFKSKYQYFNNFCAVSPGALTSFKELYNFKNKKYYVIPNYIDTKEIFSKSQEKCSLKIDTSKINIISVGRLCHQKGYDIMLNNIKELTKYRTDFHLYIIGDGPDKKKLKKQMSTLLLNKYVTFLGNQKNPFKYEKKMDLFYLNSRYEGQGMVILEAKAIGLDILIPKYLEKYCPNIKGYNNCLEYLKNYQKSTQKKYDFLEEYNKSITNIIEQMINS